MLLLVVLFEHVAAEVILKVAPDEVGMVGIVLCIGVFDEEVSSLDAEVVSFAAL